MSARTGGLLILAAVAASGCDALLTEPAPALPEVEVSFAIEGAATDGIAQAFDKVNRVYLLFVRPDSAKRDTIIRVTPREGVAKVRLVLETNERVHALGVYAQLLAGQAPLFEGQRVIRVQIGTPTSAEIQLSAIPSSLRADRPSLSLPMVGDTTRISATLRFASGDTLAAGVGTWTSQNPDIVFVTGGGLAVGRAVGVTQLIVRFQELADTVQARVVSGR